MATAKTKKKVDVAEEVNKSTEGKFTTIYLETGCVGLDLALTGGKGVPMGSNIMLFGLPGHGKTTLMGDIISRVLRCHQSQNIPFRIHYIDSENSMELLRSLGVLDFVKDNEEYHPQQVIYHQNVKTFEELENICNRIIGTIDDGKLKVEQKDPWRKDVKLIFIDSITNLIAGSQLENRVDKADFGDNAKARKKFYLKYLARLRDFGATVFWSTQMSVNQTGANMPFAEKEKPAISRFDEHNMDIITKVVKSTDSKRNELKKVKIKTLDGVKEIQTRYITVLYPGQANHTKNRFGQTVPVELLVVPGKKILNGYTIRNVLELQGCIKKIETGVYSMSEDLASVLGPDIIGEYPLNNIPERNINSICTEYTAQLVGYLKENEMYSPVAKGVEIVKDDGFY